MDTTICCKRFDPSPWKEGTVTWNEKKFVKDRIRSFLHIPLNFGTVMKRTMEKVEAAQALETPELWLNDEASPWSSDLLVAVTKDVPGAEMISLSGTYRTKIFEGPFRNAGKWAKEMTEDVQRRRETARQLLFFYSTCPKCAKKYGENYVVLLAKIA